MSALSLLLPLLLAASAVPSAPDWVLQDRSYQTFLTRLQDAVRSDDRKAVLELIDFPLRVNSESGTRLYPDAQAVARDYDRIFTPEVRRAVLDQRFDRLFGRDQGVMIGNGEIWFDHRCTNAECNPPGPVSNYRGQSLAAALPCGQESAPSHVTAKPF